VSDSDRLRAHHEPVPETVGDARRPFGCDSQRVSTMPGLACARRYVATQERPSAYVGGDICRVCPAGAARAELLAVDLAAVVEPRRGPQKNKGRGWTGHVAALAPVTPQPAPEAAPEPSMELTCPRCNRPKGAEPTTHCRRCLDVARHQVGRGSTRADFEAWCAANPPGRRQRTERVSRGEVQALAVDLAPEPAQPVEDPLQPAAVDAAVAPRLVIQGIPSDIGADALVAMLTSPAVGHDPVALPVVTLAEPGEDEGYGAARSWEPEDGWEPEGVFSPRTGPVARLCPALQQLWAPSRELGYGDSGLAPYVVELARLERAGIDVAGALDGGAPHLCRRPEGPGRTVWDGASLLLPASPAQAEWDGVSAQRRAP
jgi:hypothetical protein